MFIVTVLIDFTYGSCGSINLKTDWRPENLKGAQCKKILQKISKTETWRETHDDSGIVQLLLYLLAANLKRLEYVSFHT